MPLTRCLTHLHHRRRSFLAFFDDDDDNNSKKTAHVDSAAAMKLSPVHPPLVPTPLYLRFDHRHHQVTTLDSFAFPFGRSFPRIYYRLPLI
jgi:hypothetical protein